MHQRLFSLRFLTLIVLALVFVAQPASAGKVVKVKGKKILIKLNANEVEGTFKGDQLYLTTSSGKKKGLVVVRKMKGRKVIAQLKKGKAKKGYGTKIRKSKKKKRRSDDQNMEEASEVARQETQTTERSNLLFGFQGGFASVTQNVDQIVDQSGSMLGIKGLVDYGILEDLGVRARIGMDMLSVSGSNGATDYTTDINYLSVDLLLRYSLINDPSWSLFVLGGMGIYSPMSTDLQPTTTPPGPAIAEDSISTTSLLIFGAGVSFNLGSFDIFAGLEYLYFPPSDDVSTSAIGGNVGVIFDL